MKIFRDKIEINSRPKIFILGISLGVIYTFIIHFIITLNHENVSITYLFILPLILGGIPVLFSTKEQLINYKTYLLLPWLITMTFFFICFIKGLEGVICLVIIFGPFVLIGSLGAFIFKSIKLKRKGNGTNLYFSLLIPLIFLSIESFIVPNDQINEVTTNIRIKSNKTVIWKNIKNVKNIKENEFKFSFNQFIGIPKPLNGELLEINGKKVRKIEWEKGIKFEELINNWDEGKGFSYDIKVDSNSIPPKTLDEHVMIGGKYFDVISGYYSISKLNNEEFILTLNCKYRISTNFNFYSKIWADFILNDFNNMILHVIKNRCEKSNNIDF